ncbi:MAG: flavin reductase family protein [Bacteroidota bacterium]|nr:flavin reductase family protein [Bacteroidota bacterium]
MYRSINLKEANPASTQRILKHAIAPRPICFASTIDNVGNVNLSPFSFFNLFSTQPPVLIFSPTRRVRDNTTKHTLQNVLEVPEVVINIVSYDMVQQVSLSSCEYPKGSDEFLKSGFTKEKSILVKPPRVKESPVQLECKVLEIKALGSQGGAGNLIIAEIIMMHIDENIMGNNGEIDQRKLDLVARLGDNWYARINSDNLFEVEKPNTNMGIGIDHLPEAVKNSKILSGNQLGLLAGVSQIPEIDPSFEDEKLKNIFQYFSIDPAEMEVELHLYAGQLLDNGNVAGAWQILLALD